MTTVLGEAERNDTWQSSLTAVQFAWDDKVGWQFRLPSPDTPDNAQWRPYRGGVKTETVYARAGEEFRRVPSEGSD